MKINHRKLLIEVISAVCIVLSPLEESYAQVDTTEYRLTISEKTINLTGKDRKALAINQQIPGPTLRFEEDGYAVIYVKNDLDVETSVHWHGLILPNYYDGVPYLTTPPIEPGETQKYEFTLRQGGTYWYHSHTGLQEQLGVYGSIVIEPRQRKIEYDTDLVLVFSDWTDENPMHVMKNLKRRNEWYSIKRNTVTPLARVISRGGLGAQLKFWRQRMPGADIADVYYNAFLTNGAKEQEYPDLKPGQKVRVRMINASASTYYWLTFGGETPTLIASDGVDVVPVKRNKTLFAVAETYDFLVTVPENGKIEIRATSMDGAGKTSAFLGAGSIIAAPDVPKPDYVGIMKAMAKMEMKMGAPAMIFNPSTNEGLEKMERYGMQMKGDMSGMKMDGMENKDMGDKSTPSESSMHEGMDMPIQSPTDTLPTPTANPMQHGKMQMNLPQGQKESVLTGVGMGPDQGYDFLKSPEATSFPGDQPVREMVLNLNGNMWRYIWSMNGKVLDEADKIEIKQGEIVRITMNNLTMMNHPMHLHGHFFRVINKNGDYSPLKHTVNVAPMQSITIEFDANEYGDWFFHCHILYHMEGGMARVFSYGTPRDPKLNRYPLSALIKETNKYYFWGVAYGASHMSAVEVTTSNVRSQFNFGVEYGWNNNIESDLSYEYYLSDYFRVYGGLNTENATSGDLSQFNTVAQVGVRYLLPYFINADLGIDNQLRPQLRLSSEYLIFRRVAIFGRYEFRPDFGVFQSPDPVATYRSEQVWNVGVDYIISKNFSLTASHDNRFGTGGGLTVRF
ncbi:MAG: multicopper oxidase domain-containing protein [Imperialibacter sp.]|uniref:multicopper oxidase domain-containing protein n=1 Tax=Imperialibacter sp. TaxID=2038411 RepID=UPI003A83A720